MPDHLDKETSVSVEMTEAGLKAKAKSRLVAAVDRLGGNLFELLNAPMERRIARQRAVADGEAKLVEAVARFGIERLEHDPEFAQRAAERYFQKMFQKQENKDKVLASAFEHTRLNPPSDGAAEAGEPELDEEFLGRFEEYAEGASTEQLREKWGRVLSAEVRKPGTFSTKVLRTVDELDAETARLFETTCESRISSIIPKCLSGEIEFRTRARLVTAGLIMEPGIRGHLGLYNESKTSAGEDIWMYAGNGEAVAFLRNTELPAISGEARLLSPILLHEGRPAISAYLLTDAGSAIAEIFPRNNAFPRYVEKLKNELPNAPLKVFKFDWNTNIWRQSR